MTPMNLICVNCGESYGEHCVINDWCPLADPKLYSSVYKFLGTNAVANPDDCWTVDFPPSKHLSKECPCGIHRADCIYHA